MVRTQIQITEEQAAKLRSLAAERRRSLADLIRITIDAFLEKEVGTGLDHKRALAKAAAGKFSSSQSDISTEHDGYLAEAIRDQ
jgi:predicted transcriptional regulator